MKKMGHWLVLSWHPAISFFGGFLFLAVVLWFQLAYLVPGLSHNELVQAKSSSTIQALRDNPLGLPHKSLQYIPQALHITGPGAVRFASTVIGMVVVGGFYYILRQWYTRRVAILGTLLFASSGWFLHIARHGSDNIMYMLPLVAVACAVWLQKSKGSVWAILASGAVVLALLYVPGMIWLVIPVLLWQMERLSQFIGSQKFVTLAVLAFVGLILLVPLGLALYQDHSLAKTYFGLPQQFPSPLTIIKNMAQTPIQLFLRGPHNPEIWLARLPILDWFSTAMFVIGISVYLMNHKLDRVRFLIFIGIFGTVLASLNGPVTITLLIPFVYLVVAGGMAGMLQQWFRVFPLNPVARSVGATLMTLTVLVTSYYTVNHYFIAWPNTPETKAVYQQATRR